MNDQFGNDSSQPAAGMPPADQNAGMQNPQPQQMGAPGAPMGTPPVDASYQPSPGSPVQEPVAPSAPAMSDPMSQTQPMAQSPMQQMPQMSPAMEAPQPESKPGGKMPEIPSLAPSARHVAKMEQMLIYIYVTIASLILIRFLLSLFNANRKSTFVDFVYNLSSPFMIPFDGMFGRSVESGNVRLEFEAIVAIVIYALIFYGLVRLVRIILR